MSCDVGEVTERLENELCFTFIKLFERLADTGSFDARTTDHGILRTVHKPDTKEQGL